MLEKVKEKKAKLTSLLVLLMLGATGFAQEEQQQDHGHIKSNKEQVDSILQSNIVDAEHAAKFGKLVIQDAGGRMKPANTFASELLRKISKKDSYEGLNADQILVSMTENTSIW